MQPRAASFFFFILFFFILFFLIIIIITIIKKVKMEENMIIMRINDEKRKWNKGNCTKNKYSVYFWIILNKNKNLLN
jgi:hypothetical protein